MNLPPLPQEFCGPHCGSMAGRTAHCDCELCHMGTAPVILERRDLMAVMPKASMCDRWYAGIGDYRPWLPGRHQPLPVPEPLTRDQELLLSRLVPVADSETCSHCGSPDRAQRYYVQGGSGDPVTCPDDWHYDDARSPGDSPARYRAAPAEAGLDDPGTHHELCDESICHPECAVRRGRELEHWREVRQVIGG